MSGTFCFGGGIGAIKRNINDKIKLKGAIFVAFAKSDIVHKDQF